MQVAEGQDDGVLSGRKPTLRRQDTHEDDPARWARRPGSFLLPANACDEMATTEVDSLEGEQRENTEQIIIFEGLEGWGDQRECD